VFWSLPFDQNVGVAAQLGKPVVEFAPKSRASESMSQLLSALTKPDRTVSSGRSLLGGFADIRKRGLRYAG
jgi:hypothetical protein